MMREPAVDVLVALQSLFIPALLLVDILDALRDKEGESHPRWIVAGEATVLQLDDESAASSISLIAGGSYQVPSDRSFELDDLELEVLTQ